MVPLRGEGWLLFEGVTPEVGVPWRLMRHQLFATCRPPPPWPHELVCQPLAASDGYRRPSDRRTRAASWSGAHRCGVRERGRCRCLRGVEPGPPECFLDSKFTNPRR